MFFTWESTVRNRFMILLLILDGTVFSPVLVLVGLQVGLSGFSMFDMISVSAGAAICNRIAVFLGQADRDACCGSEFFSYKYSCIGPFESLDKLCSGCFWRFLFSERQHRQCFSWLAAYSVGKHVACVNGVADGWTEKFTNGGRQAKNINARNMFET